MKPEDIFRPEHQPAKRIYDVLKKETKHREKRKGFTWIEREIKAVHKAACAYARENGIPEPTIEQIEKEAEIASKCYHYESKWVYGVAQLLTTQNQ